jgi:hypothetical protein
LTPVILNSSGGNTQLRCVPGEAGNLFFTGGYGVGGGTNPYSYYNEFLYRSTNGGQNWSAVSNLIDVWDVGFGAIKPGQSYPAIYVYGWYTQASSTSLTVGTGTQTFTVGTGLGYLTTASTPLTVTLFETGAPTTNVMTGTLTSYNSATGQAIINVTSVLGSGTHSDWTFADGGIWRSSDNASTWQQLTTLWPLNTIDTVRFVEGDANIYGKVYFGMGSSGFGYGQFNFLLKRDLSPSLNDNTPVFLNRAA